MINKFAAIFGLFLIYPFFANSAPTEILIQMTQNNIQKLQSELKKKQVELADCSKDTKGLKIAGATTLGLTGAGLATYGILHAKNAKKGGGGGGVDNSSPPPSTDDSLKEMCVSLGNPSPECDGI
ncbi:MAG: hypothetical protein LBL75_01455 [Rickettsiales bacterium]|jgi:hypothetical protein|nr:hypothetical protein [Rickettsiales bacterium]